MSEIHFKQVALGLTVMCAAAMAGCAANPSASQGTSAAISHNAAPVSSSNATIASVRTSDAITSADIEKAESTNRPVDSEKQIVRLVGRDSVVTITTGPHGPLYSASTAAGRMIVERVTIDELRASHPDIFRAIGGTAAINSTSLIADLN